MQVAEGIWPSFKRIIKEFIDLKFDIYRYYSRELFFAKKLEILPVMVYFLIQQLILQNPVLYFVIVALRPDHITRLITFLYHI
jgi:hypothetical protein